MNLRQSLKDKKVLSTIWVVAGGLAMWLGIIVNLPRVIAMLIANGPAILSNPNTWWVIGVAVVQGFAIYFIWKRPEENEPKSRYFEFVKALNCETRREMRLCKWLFDLEDLETAVYKTARDSSHVEYALKVLEVVYQARIVELLGTEFQANYIRSLEYAKQQGKNLYIVIQTIIPMLEDAIIAALEEEQQKRSARAPKQG